LERLLSTIGSHGLLSTLANFEDLSFLLANVNVTVSTTPFDYIRPLADTREEFLFTASMASGSFILINLEEIGGPSLQDAWVVAKPLGKLVDLNLVKGDTMLG
jgi:hypothetical protein